MLFRAQFRPMHLQKFLLEAPSSPSAGTRRAAAHRFRSRVPLKQIARVRCVSVVGFPGTARGRPSRTGRVPCVPSCCSCTTWRPTRAGPHVMFSRRRRRCFSRKFHPGIPCCPAISQFHEAAAPPRRLPSMGGRGTTLVATTESIRWSSDVRLRSTSL